ncbi:serine/threonine protein phosphatase 2A 57 kDa regulatory subunit B' alpha isoform-like [Prosopis cineraria]|uniref:serine/threonine protein phosphatase 2A 57 kDa regulatory subunit B' alpha isoform-like n=1 Tax=Prosopis cineraria TaxID=364024 RepID=UPI0024109620|nr:serine/threonine protein phosphatase 2A 57 kDa regulatory subunit B' alpha isoform-like [Prosopis cineraria]
MKIPRFSISLALARDLNKTPPKTPPQDQKHKAEAMESTMGSHRNQMRTSFSPKKNSITLQNLFEQDKPALPNCIGVASSPNSGNEEILCVISCCSSESAFNDPSGSPSRQDFKRLQLGKLLPIIKSFKKPLPTTILEPLVSMISLNLFRPLPHRANPSTVADCPDDEDTISAFSPIWSHLEIVYEILLRLVMVADPEVLREYIDHPFLLKVLALFQSEDPRERESLKNVYHKIYSKFTCERSFIRKSMSDVLLNYAFETEKHAGIAELLEIWGTIINGFTVPLKEEHKLFLMRVLIPLHKTKGLPMYHRQLAYCVSQFVQKDPMLGGIVVRGILRYWPVTNCQKEVLLIGQLEELVENLEPDHYRKLALSLCAHITKCINSWNSQVAERALYVWNNEQFVRMASTAMVEVFPVIVQGMENNLKWHWSKSVRQLTESVKLMLQEMDPVLYSKGLQDMKARELEARQQDLKRKQRWQTIHEMAARKTQFLKPPQTPCVSHRSNCVGNPFSTFC